MQCFLVPALEKGWPGATRECGLRGQNLQGVGDGTFLILRLVFVSELQGSVGLGIKTSNFSLFLFWKGCDEAP